MAGDCDDTRPGVNPEAADPVPTCGDGIDDCAPEACRYEGRYELEQAAVASWESIGTVYDGRYTSAHVALVGDVDDDGREDLGLGAYVITSFASGEQDGPGVALAHLEATGNVVGWLRPARDTNGDGRDDLLVMGTGQLMPDGRRASAWVLTEVTAGESDVTEAGLPLYEPEHLYDGAGVGDLDGDGFGEVVLGGSSGAIASGAWFYKGSADGPAYEPSIVLDDGGMFGQVVDTASIGDADGDGRGDFAVSSWGANYTGTSSGAVCVFTSLPAGDGTLADAADALLTGAAYEMAGADVDSVGDVNGDGYDDLIIGHRPNYYTDQGSFVTASLVTGPVLQDGSLVQADARFFTDDPYNADFIGAVVTGAGDMDGDGADDFAIALDREGVVYLYYGMREGTQQMADADATFSHRTYYAVGNTIDGGADLDQDGYDDLLIASPFYEHDAGIAFLIGGWAP